MMGLGQVFQSAGRLRLVASVVAAAALAACGGGEQEERFEAARIVTFGDENSLIRPDGSIYSVNNPLAATATEPAVAACARSPVWVQYVAANYNIRFAECQGLPPQPYAQMKATLGGTIATTRAAVQAFDAATPLNSKDIVTLMVGAHDVLALYATRPEANGDEVGPMQEAAFQLGRDLGALVMEVTSKGAKVLITTVPNLAVAPVGLTGTEANRFVLNKLSVSFNDGLNDKLSEEPNGGGRSGAVLEVDQQIEKFRRNYNGAYSAFLNNIDAACKTGGAPMADADLPSCNLTTMQPNGTSFLWAGRIQFGLLTHGQLGSDAVTRLRANPL